MRKTLAVLLAVTGYAAGLASPPLSNVKIQSWTRLDGPPNDECIGPIYDINVAPDFALLARSDDQRVSWAVMAGSRGLDIAACVANNIHQRGFSGVSLKDPLKVSSQLLVELTKEAISSQQAMSSDDKARYLGEVASLLTGLNAPLSAMIADAKRRYPGFPRKLPPIMIPIP